MLWQNKLETRQGLLN